ncbi:MAG TPA: thiolase domain-containing protein [Anaerolineaceae bacterium]|nr:thiolase domain-containing protein [Anaerolineaceae bacterium]
MTEVVIAGIGQIPVGEHYDLSLRSMGVQALTRALRDSGNLQPEALYIGNMLAPVISHQSNLGALFTDYGHLAGIESFSAEAAGASGAAALRLAYLAIRSGYVNTAVVLGVEKWTDVIGPESESALSQELDFDYEAIPGLTSASQAGLLMQRYLYENHLPADALGGFPMLAHANAVNNPNAMYRKAISAETYARSEMLSDPLRVMDAAAFADGAAVVVLTRRDLLPADFAHPVISLTGSSVSIDTLAWHDRHDPLAFTAAKKAVESATRQAGILPKYAHLFELDDTYSIYAALSLEACGLAEKGTAWKLAKEGQFAINGKLPVMTMGGCKARGNAVGAMGVYQAVEAVQQLRGEASVNQVPDARIALTLALGGPASTAVAHVFERAEN